ncbi:MAG TPA: putative inorganic carbon transporter subunit DabA, partial [Methylomicrobium sp.]|nr:putative inorganic carbon transporter subunit DabA [Methylomicrobium sp.]
ESKFRDYYQLGRITEADLSASLRHFADLDADAIVCSVNGRAISRYEVYRIALLFDLDPITENQLNWNIDELDALDELQKDVPDAIKKSLLGDGSSPHTERDKVRQLWNKILDKLGLDASVPHPENLLDLSQEQAEEWLEKLVTPDQLDAGVYQSLHEVMRAEAEKSLNLLLAEVGERLTLGGFVKAITGIDIIDVIRPQLIRICASAMDEGMAPWQLPERDSLGLYAGWRKMFRCDVNPSFFELTEWSRIVGQLPENAIDAIIEQLTHLSLPYTKWTGYLRRLALELPGWSGMINWRQQHPGYRTDNHAEVNLTDYLAIRLIYDRLWLSKICRDVWKIEPRMDALESYFRKNLSEFMVRIELFKGELPEYLAQKAKALILRARSERNFKPEWQELSDQIRTWQLSPLARRQDRHYHWSSGWRLFRLCQHLGLSSQAVEALSRDDVGALLKQLKRFSVAEHGKVWLYAYERNYREKIFQALTLNRGRGRWPDRKVRPEAQMIFCMDEREESFRRHLEELNPALETLGAAGFFGIPMFYKGLDEAKMSPLCPVVVTPAHMVHEAAHTGSEERLRRHNEGRKFYLRLVNLLHHGLRRDVLSAHLVLDAIAPLTLLGLVSKSVVPKLQNHWLAGAAGYIVPEVATKLMFTSADEQLSEPASPKLGFTDQEQAERVAVFLKSTGLTSGFAPLVVLVGHGSISQNNPHMAAYDCGACSGRHGGPNARVFAAMANRPEVRKLLSEAGIDVPPDTWFIGAEHNTCNEKIIWFDQGVVPPSFRPAQLKLSNTLSQVCLRSAYERCRRLASAPRHPTLEEALAHIE